MIYINVGSERLDTLYMKIDWSGTDIASARHRNLRIPFSRKHGAEYTKRSPHSLYEFIWGLSGFDMSGINVHHSLGFFFALDS